MISFYRFECFWLPQNFMLKLNPQCNSMRRSTFKLCLALNNAITKGLDGGICSLLCHFFFCHVKTVFFPSDGSSVQGFLLEAQSRSSGNDTFQQPDTKLLASRTVRNTFLLFINYPASGVLLQQHK